MLVSLVRFAWRGWITELYVDPVYHFTYYGFEWVRPLGEWGMYALFFVMGLSALAIMLGWQYRIATVAFFLVFTYVELIDKTNYLNHYYFVSIISFLLIFVPAHRRFSLDVRFNPQMRRDRAPAWTVNVFKFQLGVVYFFAGLAKLNPDWLFEAMPLRLWLPAFSHLPVIGPALQWPETAFAFSWAGALYDLTIVFFLLVSRTRLWAYLAVIGFHLMTALLFQIGMFPYIMILSTLIYFSPAFHDRLIDGARNVLRRLFPAPGAGRQSPSPVVPRAYAYRARSARVLAVVLSLHVVTQLVLPFRYVLYPDDLFWTEEGYRFSWRVMLMEKAGYTTFQVHDSETAASWEVANWEYLTPNQEKMMATQPDMILQFAHFLRDEYREQGYENLVISADSYVTLNGRRSRPFIDPSVDLSRVHQGWAHKAWILPFEE